MSAPFQLYRFTHGDGSSKSWGVRFNGDGTFTSIWGKSGTKMSFKTKGISHPDDVQKLIRSKQRKGYEYLGGTFYIGDDGKISTDPPPSVPVNPEPSVEEPRIYWTIKCIKNLPSENSDSFKELSDRLKAIFVRFGKDFDEEPINKSELIKNSGIIKKEAGVFVFLFLLALKKFAPSGVTVSLSHEDGVEISDQLKLETQALSYFDIDLESIRHIAEEIGLLVKRLDLSTIAPEYQDFYF
jgi:predicted DNA-binding WGR domain protein